MTRTERLWQAMPLLALAALLAAAIPAMLGRGPWYDEFYTFYAADPGLGFWQALQTRWLPDNHPPLFYALSWASGWLGEGVEQRRFVNLFILAGFVAGFAVLWRVAPVMAQALRRWGPVYAVALAGCSIAVLTMAELRSNFLAFAASALLVAALATVGSPDARQPGRAGWAVLALAMLAGFNTHFTATVICGCLGASFWLWALLRREWVLALRLAACAALAALPFLAVTALQFSGIEANTRSFWIPAGFDAARWTIERLLLDLLGDNLALTVTGAMGLGLLACGLWRERRLAPELQLLLVLGGGAVLALAVLLGLHLWRPIIIARYLYALAPLLALVLAIGATVLLERVNALLRLAAMVVLLLMMALSLVRSHQFGNAQPNWAGTASRIGALTAACPETLVHPALHWNEYTLQLPPAGNREVVPLAYRMMAARHGFAVERPASRRIAARCPTVFWAENVGGEPPLPAQIAADLRKQGYALGATNRLERIGDGWIFIAEP